MYLIFNIKAEFITWWKTKLVTQFCFELWKMSPEEHYDFGLSYSLEETFKEIPKEQYLE